MCGWFAGFGFSQQAASNETFGHNVLSVPGTVNAEILRFLLIYSGCKWFWFEFFLLVRMLRKEERAETQKQNFSQTCSCVHWSCLMTFDLPPSGWICHTYWSDYHRLLPSTQCAAQSVVTSFTGSSSETKQPSHDKSP